jgi:hypothetical protein
VDPSDLDPRVVWILAISGLATFVGFALLFGLELWGERRDARVNPPFYLHKAAFGLVMLGLIMSVIAIIVLGFLVLRN